MRINALEFVDFCGFKHLRIDFPKNANLIVLIGENGSGKSSILEGIKDGLEFFSPNNQLVLAASSSKMSNSAGFIVKNIFYQNAFSARITLKVDNNNKINTSILIFRNKDVEITDELINYFLPVPTKGNIKKKQSLGFVLYYHIKNKAESTPNSISTQLNLKDISNYYINLETEENRRRLDIGLEYRSPELELIRWVIREGLNVLNGSDSPVYTNLKTKSIQDKDELSRYIFWLTIEKNGYSLDLEQLSDGEQQVLLLLLDITRRLMTFAVSQGFTVEKSLTCSGVVLIDELEQHLHPRWQKNLLPALGRLFPNVQFIVTTHSPLVIANLFIPENELDMSKSAVYEIKNQQAVKIEPVGRDIANVLGEFFGVERRAKIFQKQIDAFYEALESDNPDIPELKKRLDKLKNLLGETDPDVHKADTIIDNLSFLND